MAFFSTAPSPGTNATEKLNAGHLITEPPNGVGCVGCWRDCVGCGGIGTSPIASHVGVPMFTHPAVSSIRLQVTLTVQGPPTQAAAAADRVSEAGAMHLQVVIGGGVGRWLAVWWWPVLLYL